MTALSIHRDGKGFPEKLRAEVIRPPVEKLWYRGEWKGELLTKCAAVIGSRRVSRYGKQAVQEIVPRLCDAGYTIVSGLMYGVDQLAHRATLDCGGKAIAVLGYGITNRNDDTAWKMESEIENSGGMVISEYKGDSVSQMWMFPQRNRIVVGLSDVVIVVEAGITSGSLGTAKLAAQYGKTIYAVPDPIFSPVSEGTNSLIASGQAEILTLEKLSKITGIAVEKKDCNIFARLDAGEREIYTLLTLDGPQSTNELARSLNAPTREILTILALMDMKGVVSEDRGVWSVV